MKHRSVLRVILFMLFSSLPVAISFPASAPRPVGAAPALSVRAVSIFFENRRPDLTVDEGNKEVTATAELSTNGSGVLQGYWEMDGRPIGTVSQHVIGVGAVTVTSQKSPPLSPIGTGSHIVRFVVTSPSFSVPSPVALLFVVPSGISCSIRGLAILAPDDASQADYGPLTFRWGKSSESTVYLISFYDRPDGKPIFSANTKSTSYSLPEKVVKKNFTAGRKYFWRVTGFDRANHTICENRRFSFTFKHP